MSCEIWKGNFVAFKAEGIHFDKFKSGWVHEKHAVATGNLGTISAFSRRQSQTKATSVQTAKFHLNNI
jgi:hypothetical protein